MIEHKRFLTGGAYWTSTAQGRGQAARALDLRVIAWGNGFVHENQATGLRLTG